MVTTDFSSPFKDVVWKVPDEPSTCKFGADCAHEIPGRGKVAYGKHLGEDYFIEAGTPVLAVADGYVRVTTDVPGTPERPQWGGVIVIGHWISKDRCIYSIYGHLERNKDLQVTSFVKKGQEIGKVAGSNSAGNGFWNEPTQLHLQFMLDPKGKYPYGRVPTGYDSTVQDGKLAPLGAPYRLLDHIAPSQVFDAKDPVALLRKEEASPDRSR